MWPLGIALGQSTGPYFGKFLTHKTCHLIGLFKVYTCVHNILHHFKFIIHSFLFEENENLRTRLVRCGSGIALVRKVKESERSFDNDCRFLDFCIVLNYQFGHRVEDIGCNKEHSRPTIFLFLPIVQL